jgi:hypothetical protein
LGIHIVVEIAQSSTAQPAAAIVTRERSSANLTQTILDK